MTDEHTDWLRQTFDTAVNLVMSVRLVHGAVAEARPVWYIPNEIIVGQMRVHRDDTDFVWIVCGDVPTDHIDSEAADNPRDAIRHFAMKWQMNAARFSDPETRATLNLPETTDWEAECRKVETQAERLYALAESDAHWES